MRKLFSLILIALVMLSGVVLNSNKSFLRASSLNKWRSANIRVSSSSLEITKGENFYFYAQILNDSNQVLELDFNDECDVGFRLRDRSKKIIRSFKCENFEGNKIILGPGEYENIDFKIEDLDVGIYRIDAVVGPFKNKFKIDFSVISPVEYISFEGGMCGGIQQYTCAEGLVCALKTNPLNTEGVCMMPEQVTENSAKKEITTNSYNSLFSMSEDFNKYGYISDYEFIQLMKKYTNREIIVRSKDGYISRATALTAMYRTMIRSKHPEALEVNYFSDSKWSKYGNYIEESADLGLIEVPKNKLFIPNGRLTWDVAEDWLGQFSR